MKNLVRLLLRNSNLNDHISIMFYETSFCANVSVLCTSYILKISICQHTDFGLGYISVNSSATQRSTGGGAPQYPYHCKLTLHFEFGCVFLLFIFLFCREQKQQE